MTRLEQQQRYIERVNAEEQTIPDDIPLIELADMVVRGKVKLSRRSSAC